MVQSRKHKNKLLFELENLVESECPPSVDLTIIDGMYLLHLFVDPPGCFARQILVMLRNHKGSQIHLKQALVKFLVFF